MDNDNTKGSETMNNGTSYGSKYSRDLDIAQIAKLVRADIKAAVKAGTLPVGLKAGVRISRYSMGQSLDVTIKAAPGVALLNPARVAYEAAGGIGAMSVGQLRIHSDAATALRTTVEQLVEAYNFDGSEPMTDYYHVNFYGNVRFDHDLEMAERAAA